MNIKDEVLSHYKKKSRKLLTPNQIKYVRESGTAGLLQWEELFDFLYSVGYYDTDKFMKIFLPHRMEDPATWRFVDSWIVHKKIDEWYEEMENLALVLPRWFAKTTRVLVNIMKDLLYWERQALWYLAWWDLWTESIWRLRVEFETNDLIKSVFWSLSPEDQNSAKLKKLKKWKQQFLQLVNGNSIETLSPGQRIRWRRKNKRVIDDPDEDGDSRAKRKKFRSFVFSTIYNTMMPWWYMICIWTIVWADCFVLYLKDQKKRKTIMYKAIENWKSIRPEMRSLESLEQRKKAIWTNMFNQEFMHVPLSSDDALIRLERCKRYDVNALPKFERTILSIDPAKKEKESSDFTGIVYWGIANGKFYVIRTKQVKLSPLKNEIYLDALIKKVKPDYVLKEDNVELWITESLANKGHNMVWVNQNVSKRNNLLEVSPRVERWDVLFRQEGDEELLHQITNFPNVQHDDIMDAFTMFVLYWSKVTNNDLYII